MRLGELHGVQLLVNIFVGYCIVANFFAQVRAKRFYHRKYHLTTRSSDRVILNEVETTIAIVIAVSIQSVKIHDSNERFAGNVTFINIRHLGSCSVVKILYIKLEVGFLNLISA